MWVSSLMRNFFFADAKGEKNIRISYFLLSLAGFAAVIFFVNKDIIFEFDMEKFKFIFFSFLSVAKCLIAAFVFFVAAYSVGNKILSLLKMHDLRGAERLLFSWGLGIGFLGYAFFFLSALQLAYTWAAYILLLIIFLIGYKDVKAVILGILRKKIEIDLEKDNLLEKLAAWLLAILFLAALVYVFSNLMNAGWDTFHQYLTFPDAYQQNHGLVYFPFHPHWGFPQLSEMIFLGGMLLGGLSVPFLLNYVFVLLGIWGLFHTFEKIHGRYNIWIISIVASMPLLIIFYIGYLKVEPLLFFYVVLAFVSARRIFLDPQSKKQYIVLSIFLGLLLAIKYTSIFFLASFFISFWIFRRKFDLTWKKMLYMAAIIFLVFSPWMVKNYIFYKSPLYPLLSGRDYFSEHVGANCHKYFVDTCKEDNFLVRGSDVLKMENQFLTNILLETKAFAVGDIFGITSTGPFIIIFLPWVIWIYFRNKDAYLRFLSVFSLVFLLIGILFFTGQVWYFLPLVVSYALALSYAWERKKDSKEFVFARYIILFWLLTMALALLLNARLFEDVRYIRGEVSFEEALANINKEEGSYGKYDLLEMSRYINDNILNKDTSKVIIYGFLDPQGYFIKNSFRSFIPDFYGYLFRCLSKNGEIYDNMKKLGVNYFIFDPGQYSNCRKPGYSQKFLTCQTKQDFKVFLEKHGQLIHTEGSYGLYLFK